MTENAETPAVYDVRELSAKLVRLSRIGWGASWGILGVGIIVLIVCAGRLLGPSHGGNLAVLATGVGFGVFLIGLSYWSIRHSRKGADVVSVDNEGVHLHYRSGRVAHLLWADPHLAFNLQDGSVLPAEVTKGGLLYTLIVSTGDTPLPIEAFFDVLTRAQQHGLVARSGRDRMLLMPRSMWLMEHHIRGSRHRAKNCTVSP
jgi:hypothetical protein